MEILDHKQYWETKKAIAIYDVEQERIDREKECDREMKAIEKELKEDAREEADRKKEATDRSAERNNNVCDNIANLASAMSSLDGIDPSISEYDAKDLAEMKQQLVASMKYYLGKLPG